MNKILVGVFCIAFLIFFSLSAKSALSQCSGSTPYYIWEKPHDFNGCSGNDCTGITEDTNDDACCSDQYSCVHDGVCTGRYAAEDFGIDIGLLKCDGGTRWKDPDYWSSTQPNAGCDTESYKGVAGPWVKAGESGVGEYDSTTKYECCGDDYGEYYITNSQYATEACCSSPNDYVDAYGNCQDRAFCASRPCLFFNSTELGDIRSKAQDNSLNIFNFRPKDSFESIKGVADSYISEDYTYNDTHACLYDPGTNHVYYYQISNSKPPIPPCKICCPDTHIGKAIEERLVNLAFVYAVTQETKYFNKAKEILTYVSNWEDWDSPVWDPGSGYMSLMTASLIRGSSFAYDVLYNDLTESERTLISNAIFNKGVKLMGEYAETTGSDPVANGHIAAIGAIGIGSLAVEDRETGVHVYLDYAMQKLDEYLANQEPDGGWYEGVFYGHYAMELLLNFAVPIKRLGIKDIFNEEFMKKTWKYPVYLTSSNKMAHFNDAGWALVWNNELAYDACVLKNEEAAWYLNKHEYKFDYVFPFIWLDDYRVTFREPDTTSILFRDMGTAALRYNWDDSYPVIFFKSGPDPLKESFKLLHNQYDENTFIITHNGKVMASDAGYGHPETYKHNTLLVDGQGQDEKFGGRVSDFYASQNYGYVKGDASKVYNSLSKFDRNVFYVMPDYFVIYDEIESPTNHKFSWLIHADLNGNVFYDYDNEVFEIRQPNAILKGKVTSNVQTTTSIETMTLTQTTEYLNVTTVSTNNPRFLSILYPSYLDLGDEVNFVSINQDSAEVQYGGNVDVVSVNTDPGLKSFHTSKGFFECDGFFCVAGTDSSDDIRRIIVHNGKDLELGNRQLFSSNAQANVSLKENYGALEGDIRMSSTGSVGIYFEALGELYVDDFVTNNYNYDGKNVDFNLAAGAHKIVLNPCGLLHEGIDEPFESKNEVINNGGSISGVSFTTGKIGNAALINNNDVVSFPTACGRFNLNEGSIEFWVKPNWNGNDGLFHSFFNEMIGSTDNRLAVGKFSTGKLTFFIWEKGTLSKVDYDVSGWVSGEWHHLGFSWNSSEMRIYIDRENVNTTYSVNLPSMQSGTMFIGTYNSAGEYPSDAVIDEFKIYSQFRTEFGIKADINGDGKVNIDDLIMISSVFGLTDSDTGWNATRDVVEDGEIDVYDLVFVAGRFT